MHMCMVAAAIANDGVMMEPRLLSLVESPAGNVRLRYSQKVYRTACSPEMCIRDSYAPSPRSDAEWEELACFGDEMDEDMTDAAAPPRSAYVGHDEAERAKRKVWVGPTPFWGFPVRYTPTTSGILMS